MIVVSVINYIMNLLFFFMYLLLGSHSSVQNSERHGERSEKVG